MSKAEQTKQFIIENSALIFNIKGYQGTSLSDIQEKTKLTKGAIYGNFYDKNELALAAFDHNSSKIILTLCKRMKNAASSEEALLAYTDYYVQNWESVFNNGGCPLINAAVEADDHLYFMRENVRGSIKRVLHLLQEVIEQGQAKSEFKLSANAVKYATMIFSLMQGSIFIAKIMDDKKYLQITSDRITQIIEKELKQ